MCFKYLYDISSEKSFKEIAWIKQMEMVLAFTHLPNRSRDSEIKGFHEFQSGHNRTVPVEFKSLNQRKKEKKNQLWIIIN